MRGMKSLNTLAKCILYFPPINQFFFFILTHHSESLVDEPSFPEKELAASIASKVFYYLEEYEESLRLALEAGSKFDLNEKSQYVETLIHKCIDQYTQKRLQIYDKHEENVVIEAKMDAVINRMFDRCFSER